MRVSQGKILIGELLHDASGSCQLERIEAANRQAGQGIEKCQKLYRPLMVVTAEKPPVPLGDHQR